MYTTGKATTKGGHTGGQWAGKGKDWSKQDAERLSHMLVIDDVLQEEARSGYKNAQIVYIRVTPSLPCPSI